jgi:hypothetical protein
MLAKPAYTVFRKQSCGFKDNFEIIVDKWISRWDCMNLHDDESLCHVFIVGVYIVMAGGGWWCIS